MSTGPAGSWVGVAVGSSVAVGGGGVCPAGKGVGVGSGVGEGVGVEVGLGVGVDGGGIGVFVGRISIASVSVGVVLTSGVKVGVGLPSPTAIAVGVAVGVEFSAAELQATIRTSKTTNCTHNSRLIFTPIKLRCVHYNLKRRISQAALAGGCTCRWGQPAWRLASPPREREGSPDGVGGARLTGVAMTSRRPQHITGLLHSHHRCGVENGTPFTDNETLDRNEQAVGSEPTGRWIVESETRVPPPQSSQG